MIREILVLRDQWEQQVIRVLKEILVQRAPWEQRVIQDSVVQPVIQVTLVILVILVS